MLLAVQGVMQHGFSKLPAVVAVLDLDPQTELAAVPGSFLVGLMILLVRVQAVVAAEAATPDK